MKKSIKVSMGIFVLSASLVIMTGCSVQGPVSDAVDTTELPTELSTELPLPTGVPLTTVENPKSSVSTAIESIHFETLDDWNCSIATLGGKYLEDGMVIALAHFNENDEIAWMQTWNGIQVSELDTHSPIAGNDEMVCMVVEGTLYAFDLTDGGQKWAVSDVGASGVPPLMDPDTSMIYLIGQYAPYVTAVSESGDRLWQITSEDFFGAYAIEFKGDALRIQCMAGEIQIDKNGKVLAIDRDT